MNNKKHILTTLLLISIFSCENDLDVILPADPVPVVYSLLDNSDTAHIVKLSKTFIMDKGMLTQNISTDSLVFPDAQVFLERWNGDYIFDRAELIPLDIARDDGLFPPSPNPHFYLPKNESTMGLFSVPNPNDVVKLIIDIPGLELIYSQTVPQDPIVVTIPRKNGNDPYLYGEKVWEIKWSTNAYYNELFLEFCYFDHYNDSTQYQSVTWREFHSVPELMENDPPAYNNYTDPLSGQHLMIRIGGNIKVNKQVRYRTFDRIKIHYYSTDENVYTHNLTSQINSIDQTGIQFNNIVNGVGLFGTRSRDERWFILGFVEMDSLAKGQFTKDLGFVNW